jgi:hypothetical protein
VACGLAPTSSLAFALLIMSCACTFICTLVVVRLRRTLCCVGTEAEEERIPSNQQPFLQLIGGGAESESVELVARSMMKAHETSPGEKGGFSVAQQFVSYRQIACPPSTCFCDVSQ